MEALFSSLVAKYGFEYAAKLLGIDQQSQNPKYAISLGGNTFDLGNMAKKAGLNQGIKSLMGGNMSSLMGPAALLGGAVMLGRAFDPTRPGSRNYSPNLSGQIDYLSGISGMIGRNPSSGLMQYGPESVLRGQNVMSMFGTNNYQDQLQNYIDKMEARKTKGFNTIGIGPFKTKTTGFTDFQQKQLDKAKKELSNIRDNEIQQELNREVQSRNQVTKNLMTQNNAYTGGGGGGGFDTSAADRAGTSAGSGQFSPSTSRGRSGYGKGGIASL